MSNLGTTNTLEEIRARISDPAMLEQCAEECMELAHACLKMARKLRGENYTPKTIDEISENLREEFVDVNLCQNVLYETIFPNPGDYSDRYMFKLNRWHERICGVKHETR